MPKKAKKTVDPDDIKSFNIQEREILEKLRNQFLELLEQNKKLKSDRYQVKESKNSN